MNESFWTSGWKRLMLYILLLLPIIVLLFFRTILSPSLLYGLLFLGILCAFLALAIFLASMNWQIAPHLVVEPVSQDIAPGDIEVLPAIPRTLDEVFDLGDKLFEIFSAAVIIGLGEGRRFLKHCRQS